MKTKAKSFLLALLSLACIMFLMMGVVLVNGQGMMPPTNRPSVEQWMATHTNSPNTNSIHQVKEIEITFRLRPYAVFTRIDGTTNFADWYLVTNLPDGITNVHVPARFDHEHFRASRVLIQYDDQ